MVIMNVGGGFANQLYKYACAYTTAKRYGQELILVAQTTDGATDPFQLCEFNLYYSELYVVKNDVEVYKLFLDWKKTTGLWMLMKMTILILYRKVKYLSNMMALYYMVLIKIKAFLITILLIFVVFSNLPIPLHF